MREVVRTRLVELQAQAAPGQAKATLTSEMTNADIRYKNLVDNAFVGIFQADASGQFTVANHALVAILGYKSLEEILSAEARWHFASVEDYQRIVDTVTAKGQVADWIQTIRKRDGTPIVIKGNLRANLDKDGELLYINGMIQDITLQRRAEAEARKLANFPRIDPHLILELNEWGAIQYFNPAASRFLTEHGKPAEDIYSILPANLEAICHSLLAQLPKSTSPTRYEVVVGERLISYEFYPMRDDKIVLVRGADLTEQRRIEVQLQQTKELEIVSRLARGISHDFNNLLTGILGHVSLLREQLPPDSPFFDSISQIEKSGQRAAHITRQLQVFCRKASVDPIAIDINQLLQTICEALQKAKPPQIQFSWDLVATLPQVKLDPAEFHQVISCLFENACVATAQQGEIKLRTFASNLQESDTFAKTPAKCGQFVVVAIGDNGVGIAPQKLRRIFEPFYTSDKGGSSSGMGLATVYGIVRTHGGTIHVESEVGKGSEFRLYFPAVS